MLYKRLQLGPRPTKQKQLERDLHVREEGRSKLEDVALVIWGCSVNGDWFTHWSLNGNIKGDWESQQFLFYQQMSGLLFSRPPRIPLNDLGFLASTVWPRHSDSRLVLSCFVSYLQSPQTSFLQGKALHVPGLLSPMEALTGSSF